MIDLIAQNTLIGNLIIWLCVGLGLLAVCIPRPRKRYVLQRDQQKKSRRHEEAGSLQRQSRYGARRR